MSIVNYAETELDIIGMTADSEDEMNVMMRKHILHMVNEFAKEGHSGMSARWALNILSALLDWRPLSPLTGEDDEWTEIGDNHWQNKRASSVFKDETGAYWGEGRVFWEIVKDNPEDINAEPYKTYFTSRDSRVPITFPFTMPDKPEYVEADPDR
jgi:hypothetical protein